MTRQEGKGDFGQSHEDTGAFTRFLEADALVPIDGKPLDLLKDKELPPTRRRPQKSSTTWSTTTCNTARGPAGAGDADWACDSGYGNCTDFHSLFISLARSQKIPAKFEIGFPLPHKHGAGDDARLPLLGLVQPTGKGWVPVDISEANKNPKMTRLLLRQPDPGPRRLQHRPRPDAGAEAGRRAAQLLHLPYVEVDGKPYPADKVKRKFSFN